MNKIYVLILSLFLLITGCAENNQQDMADDVSEPENISTETENDESQEQRVVFGDPKIIAENLVIPWSIEKIGDTFYLTERLGFITRIENGETVR